MPGKPGRNKEGLFWKVPEKNIKKTSESHVFLLPFRSPTTSLILDIAPLTKYLSTKLQRRLLKGFAFFAPFHGPPRRAKNRCPRPTICKRAIVGNVPVPLLSPGELIGASCLVNQEGQSNVRISRESTPPFFLWLRNLASRARPSNRGSGP